MIDGRRRGVMADQTSHSDRRAGGKSTGIFYKFLRLFTVIHPGEALTAFLLTFNVFLLFLAYYIIKPVREALILAGKGAEVKSYLAAVIAVLLILVVKAFSSIASRFSRQKLITWVTLFFISNLVIFYILSFSGIQLGTMGMLFYIWVGVFNVMVVAQFWGFANDLYSEDEGKRLFPMIAFGATFGAFSGSTIAGWLVKPLGLYQMMLVAGGFLFICIGLTWMIHTREIRRAAYKKIDDKQEKDAAKIADDEPLKKGGGFQLVFKKRYLLYIALFVLFLNFINTNGEFILGDYVKRTAPEVVEMGKAAGLTAEEYIGKFYADFFKYFNLVAMVIQLFFVSRLFKWVGVRGAIFFLPFIALGGYFFIALGASLMLVFWVKVMENGTDYSLMNTTRHALFLITSREEKYKAKAATDTFFHRSGDVLSALVVFLGVNYLAFNTSRFAAFNVVLIAIWIGLGVLIAKEHKRLSAARS